MTIETILTVILGLIMMSPWVCLTYIFGKIMLKRLDDRINKLSADKKQNRA